MKILRGSKFTLITQVTRLETTHLNQAAGEKPQVLTRLLVSVFLPLRIITVKVIRYKALGSMVYTLYAIYLSQ